MSTVYKPACRPGKLPPDGEAEFLIHAACKECGWRCAIPGEGQEWPHCPRCKKLVMPRRAHGMTVADVMDERRNDPDFDATAAGFGESRCYIGIVLPEEHGLAVTGIKYELRERGSR